MAKPSATLSLLFFFIIFLFAFSEARTTLDFPKFTIFDRPIPKSFPKTDPKDATILLPSQKPELELATVVDDQDFDTNTAVTTTGSKAVGPYANKGGKQDPGARPDRDPEVPLTLLNLNLINRFPRGVHARRFPLRLPHRCRDRFRPTTTRFSVLRYGDHGHLIFSGGEGFPEEIPMMPVRYAHGLPVFPHKHNHHPHSHRRHHRRSSGSFYVEDDRKPPSPSRRAGGQERVKEREKGGLLKRIRKFLNQF